MAKFSKKVILDDKEKDFITTELSLFLKKNDMLSVRSKIMESWRNDSGLIDDASLSPADATAITGFLLQNLGEETYFSGSREIFIEEFCDLNSLISISIPEGIERIEDYAFNSCSNLKNVIIPDSVKYIGYDAFTECSLTKISVPRTCHGYMGVWEHLCDEDVELIIRK